MCIFFIGFIFTIVGIFTLIYPFYHKIKCTEPAMAKVIGFEKRWSRGSKGRMGRYIYYPVFKYVVEGITYEEEYRGQYNNRAREELKNINIDEIPEKTRKFIKKIKDVNLVEYEVGKNYKLLVNKNNPKEYWIAEDGANKGREYILIIIGAVFLGISIIRKIFGFIF